MIPQTFTLNDRDGFTRTWELTPSGDVRYVCHHRETGFSSVEYVAFADASNRIFQQGKNAEILQIKVS